MGGYAPLLPLHVTNIIFCWQPDCLFIELDLKRIAAAFRGGRPIAGLKIALWDSEGNPRIGVTAPRPEPNPIIKWLLARETSQMFAGQGFLAGEEFITSVEEAAKLDAVVVLGDRDFGKSMGRLAEASSKTDIHKFLEADKAMAQLLKKEIPDIERWEVGSKTPSKEEIKDLIEGMKTKEKVDKLMQIFREYAPEVYVALVKERDEYMSKGLDALLIPQTTVAVVGMAHVTGVTKNLEAMGWQHVPHLC